MSTGFTHQAPGGGSMEWYTPPEMFSALDVEYDLDPCAPPLPKAAWIPAARRYSLPQDGLTLPWEGRVWLNPPYARETGRWVAKLADHGDGIALVFARTDTAWFQGAIARAHAVCFIAGRVNFRAADPAFVAKNRTTSNSGSPSCLLAYGDDCAAALVRCGLGVVLVAEDACVRAQMDLWEAHGRAT